MEHQIAYNQLSEQARQAWETINGLPLTTPEQHEHAWQILRREFACLADDPQPGLHVVADDLIPPVCELYLSGAELAALRVLIAWLTANDRAGRVRDLPIYPEVAHAIVAQCGDAPWPDVWSPSYLDAVIDGGTLMLHLQTSVPALLALLEAALRRSHLLCPNWPSPARHRLLLLLCDVWYWLYTTQVAHAHERVT